MKKSIAKRLTPEQIQIIISRYPNELSSDLANELGVTISQVYHCAHSNKVFKSDKFKSDLVSGRFNLISAGMQFRFKPGQISHNKGSKMPIHIREKCKHTFFQAGHKPKNTKESGLINIRNCKGINYKWIKIEDSYWKLLHRHVWEQKFGEIPKDVIISFVDGDSLNCELSNLFMISKAENLQRNRELSAKYPPELKEVIKLSKKLKKTIEKWQQTK